MTEKEIWKPVKNITDEPLKGYEVSNLGNFRKKVGNSGSNYRYMKRAHPNTYKRIVINDSNYKRGYRAISAQNLVLNTFGSYDSNLRVIHLDGDITNNAFNNLKQVSQKELADKTKNENKGHIPEYRIMSYDKETHKLIKEYNFYIDGARDVYKEEYGQDSLNHVDKRILKNYSQNIRNAVVMSDEKKNKYGIEAYGRLWKGLARNEEK